MPYDTAAPLEFKLTPPPCGPQVIMPRMATFGQPGTLPLFFAGSVQLLPVRDPHAGAARAAASLDTALDTAAG